MSTMQLIEYNGEYYVMPQSEAQPSGYKPAGYWSGGGVPSMSGLSAMFQPWMTKAAIGTYYDRLIAQGKMTPFSQMLRPQQPQQAPIIPKPFAGWGTSGAGQNSIPVPAAPTLRNPQSAPAPTAPQGQPNTNAGGTNWDLAKINAFQNTGR